MFRKIFQEIDLVINDHYYYLYRSEEEKTREKDRIKREEIEKERKKERKKFDKIVKNKKFDRIFNFREELVDEYLLNDKNCDEVISFFKKINYIPPKARVNRTLLKRMYQKEEFRLIFQALDKSSANLICDYIDLKKPVIANLVKEALGNENNINLISLCILYKGIVPDYLKENEKVFQEILKSERLDLIYRFHDCLIEKYSNLVQEKKVYLKKTLEKNINNPKFIEKYLFILESDIEFTIPLLKNILCPEILFNNEKIFNALLESNESSLILKFNVSLIEKHIYNQKVFNIVTNKIKNNEINFYHMSNILESKTIFNAILESDESYLILKFDFLLIKKYIDINHPKALNTIIDYLEKNECHYGVILESETIFKEIIKRKKYDLIFKFNRDLIEKNLSSKEIEDYIIKCIEKNKDLSTDSDIFYYIDRYIENPKIKDYIMKYVEENEELSVHIRFSNKVFEMILNDKKYNSIDKFDSLIISKHTNDPNYLDYSTKYVISTNRTRS